MNKLSKLLCGLAFLSMAAGCSDDVPSGGTQPEDKSGDVYARLVLSLPGSRSQTSTEEGQEGSGESTSGFEIGQDYENAVSSVLVILTSEVGGQYGYVTSTIADNTSGKDESLSDEFRPAYTVTFSSEEVEAVAGQTVYVFAVCNPTAKIVERVTELRAATATEVGGSLNNLICNLNEDGEISNPETFLMANASLSSVILPSAEKLAQEHNSPDKPFHLGVIDVSRVTSRFDFRTTKYKYDDGTEEAIANRFPIYDDYAVEQQVPKTDAEGNIIRDEEGNIEYETITTEGTQLMGYVKIDAMALMNEAENYYLFPRVSANGMGANVSLCGQEHKSNFVVSPGFDEKTETPLNLTWLQNNYRYNGIEVKVGETLENGKYAYNYNTFEYESLDKVMNGKDDDDYNWTVDGSNDVTRNEGYKIWRYVTENTIPGKDLDGIQNSIEYQRIGVTTCIVFRAVIEPTEESKIKEQMVNGANIYSYNNRLIGDMTHLREEVEKSPISALADAYAAACEANGVTLEEAKTLKDFDQTGITTRGEGLKIFKPSADDGNYYCYYIYRNRHNDNLQTFRMGPMEFATVRNNIYKIDIRSILEFGHTEFSKDDPDPETPETPDEPNKTYFRLSVRVLPWVVRINHVTL